MLIVAIAIFSRSNIEQVIVVDDAMWSCSADHSQSTARYLSFAVAYKERPPSPTKTEKSPPAGQKGKPKGKVEKGSKDKQDNKGSRPPSQQFDITKPNWTLRIVVDAATAVSGAVFGWLL